jgi:drug/metabolite transporter (DMT)-like permease
MQDSLHLFFPLLSSILFVLAATFARRATSLGVTPYTATALSNFTLAAIWLVVGATQGAWIPLASWWEAVWVGAAFVTGQLATYLAFRLGDVSLATPVFGVKIILVALISSMLADQGITPSIWIAAFMATLGVAIIQFGASSSSETKLTARRAAFSIGFALLAAILLSIFDIAVQRAGKRYGALPFLSSMFVSVGFLSVGLLPWTNSVAHIRSIGASRSLLLAAFLMATQGLSVTYALGQFGDATRINIVYSLRGLWSVLFAWIGAHYFTQTGSGLARSTLFYRFIGAVMVTLAIVIALVR